MTGLPTKCALCSKSAIGYVSYYHRHPNWPSWDWEFNTRPECKEHLFNTYHIINFEIPSRYRDVKRHLFINDDTKNIIML
jgi:hypothetical protein